MKKATRIRIMCGITGLTMAACYHLAKLDESVHAEIPQISQEELNSYARGTFLDLPIEEEGKLYNRYVVDKGDNLSEISRKICEFYSEKREEKYWPVLAFMNDYPRTIKPGDIIKFPTSIEKMDNLLDKLWDNKWTQRYIQKNNVYGKTGEKSEIKTIGELLKSIYGDEVCVDPDFVALYLKTVGIEGDYDIDYVIDDEDPAKELGVHLTIFIPSDEQLEETRKEMQESGKELVK